MAYTTINKSTDYFTPFTFSGTGQSSVTGVGFTPDMFIHKNRGNTQSWGVIDVVRGNNNYLGTNSTNAQLSDVGNYGIASDGYTFPHADQFFNSGNMVYYNWKAGGTGSANSNGSIASTVSVNNTAGFSIVKYTGYGGVSTVGHGLNVAPKVIINKNFESGSTSWFVGGWNDWTKRLKLEGTNDWATNTVWNDTAPTNQVFSLNGTNANSSGQDYIAYCFAEKTGYSKFGSYTGNGSSDGTFVYTGFKPAFVITKANISNRNWVILDNKRLGYNDKNYRLFPNLNNAEDTTSGIVDFTSNGFKFRSNNNVVNESSVTYIYMAFGQSLVGSNNVPCTAR